MDLLSLGKDPINPDQPAGADVRDEPEFEALKAEIAKLSSPSAAGTIDWSKVTDLAAAILSQKSKNILVASYLAVARVFIEKIDGLMVGSTIIRDLLDNFWKDLYPPKNRMRGRVMAIEWWLEKTASLFEQVGSTPSPPEIIQQCKENFEHIGNRLVEYLPNPPKVRKIQRLLDTIPVISEEKPTAEESRPQEALQPKKAAEPKPAKAPPPTPVLETEEITSEKDAQRILRFGFQKIRQVAAYLHENEPTNPLAYRCTRLAAWSPVEALPPAVDGKTRIPPPPAQMVNVLNEQRQKEDWEALLNAAEKRMSQFIFWLDLNRFVAEALVRMGYNYQKAHDVVCLETAFLVHRLQGLEELAFSDGMPFADPETKKWLKGVQFGQGAVIDEPVLKIELGLKDGDDDQMAEKIKKSQSLIKEKKFVEAVESLQKELKQSGSQKKMLRWRLALSQILMSAKQTSLAAPHFEQVLQDIELYRLEEWDPDLALEGLKLIWAGFDSQTDKVFKSKAAEILNRIARLDPAEALRLEKT
jgi:type VI secretion system protein VasJ